MKTSSIPPLFRGLISLIVGMTAMTWSNVLLAGLGAKGFPITGLVGLVTVIGSAAILVPVIWGGLRGIEPRRVTGGIALLTVASLAINYFYGRGVVHVSLAVFVAAETAGLLIAAAFPESRRQGLRAFAWPGLALAGVFVLVRPWEGQFNLAGVIFSFLAGVGIAGRLVVTKKIVPEERAFARGLSGLLAGLGLMGLAPEVNSVHLSVWVVLIILVAGVTNTAIPGIAEVVAARTLKASTISVVLASTPIVALAFTCVGAARMPTLAECGATALVVAGAVGAARAEGDSSARA